MKRLIALLLLSFPLCGATKLYLRDTKVNAIGVYRDLLDAAGASVVNGVVNTTSGYADIQWTKTGGGELLTFISGRTPTGGFTLAGNITFSIWGKYNADAANTEARVRVFRRTAAGTETEVGGGPFDKNLRYTTTIREDVWTGTPTSTAFAVDDRLILKVYITYAGTSPMVGGYTSTINYDAADAATGDSFISLTETVAFKAEGAEGRRRAVVID